METKRNNRFPIRIGLFLAGGLAGAMLLMLLGADLVQTTQGPYQISASEGESVFIVDTRNGHVWQRQSTFWRDFGTPDDPEYKSRQVSR